jgi:hypothetical protein
MAKTVKPPKPKGFFVFGTNGKMYEVKNKAALAEVCPSEMHGIGIKKASASRAIPDPKSEGDVSGHDAQLGVWHMWWAWGWIYSLDVNRMVYVYHYHPYGTDFAIYV